MTAHADASVDATRSVPESAVEVATPQSAPSSIEVVFQTTEVVIFDSLADLKTAILDGRVGHSLQARVQTTNAAGVKTESQWTTVEALARGREELRGLYQPVWHHTMRYLGYGVIAGIALKALDTTITMFAIDEQAAVGWLVVLGSLLLAKKWGFAPIIAAIFVARLGIHANLFVTVFATAAVGALFGVPGGMIVGTLVGHFRKSGAAIAPDAPPEGRRPYVLGLALPLAFLAPVIPGYIWLNVKLIEWLA